jgi:hypothetical protein
MLSFLALTAALQGVGLAADPPGTVEQRYLLLLLEDGRYQAARGSDHAARVDEYRNWSRGTPGVESGDEVRGSGWMLTAAGTSPAALDPAKGFVAGLFVIRASGDEEALRVARTCPHLTHGGAIELRPLN